jgi:dTDP-4-dehydrorhamnose reductase
VVTGGANRDVKILILGGGGMLGHKMFQVLGHRFPDTWCTLREPREDSPLGQLPLFQAGRVLDGVDASNVEALERFVRDVRPAVIVNCVGVIKQRSEAQSIIGSITVNALLPHRLARVASEWNGRLIHFSTDCVFSGRKGQYREADEPDPVDLYGRTKLLGEVAADNALTLRTSFIGRELRHGQSLLEWFLAQNHQKVGGYRRVWWSGTTSNHLAEVVGNLIGEGPPLAGLYHLSGVRLSKYDLLLKLRDGLGLDLEVEPSDTVVCDRSLDGSRFAQATGYRAPSWDGLIAQLVSDPTPYDRWGSQHAHAR